MSEFTVDYFIAKFEAIPDKFWCIKRFNDPWSGAHCALGHCNWSGEGRESEEGMALNKLLMFETTYINDYKSFHYPQETPKERMLAALADVKAGTFKG